MPAPRPPPPASRRPQPSLLPGVWGGPSAGAFSRCGAPSSLNGWGPTPPEAVHAPSTCLRWAPGNSRVWGGEGSCRLLLDFRSTPPPRVALPSSWGSSPGGWEGRSNSASDNIGLRRGAERGSKASPSSPSPRFRWSRRNWSRPGPIFIGSCWGRRGRGLVQAWVLSPLLCGHLCCTDITNKVCPAELCAFLCLQHTITPRTLLLPLGSCSWGPLALPASKKQIGTVAAGS